MTAASTIELSYGMTAVPDARPDERALVIAAQRGSGDAFATLVRNHQRRAYAVCRAIVLTHEDAEDAVQEGFLHAFK
ncbi:MAG TPA: sigma factor, partial [Gemmatimonadaceae bacterium]|nr:sigma factor [Gemmatimonadaceae bacterium]